MQFDPFMACIPNGYQWIFMYWFKNPLPVTCTMCIEQNIQIMHGFPFNLLMFCMIITPLNA